MRPLFILLLCLPIFASSVILKSKNSTGFLTETIENADIVKEIGVESHEVDVREGRYNRNKA